MAQKVPAPEEVGAQGTDLAPAAGQPSARSRMKSVETCTARHHQYHRVGYQAEQEARSVEQSYGPDRPVTIDLALESKGAKLSDEMLALLDVFEDVIAAATHR